MFQHVPARSVHWLANPTVEEGIARVVCVRAVADAVRRVCESKLCQVRLLERVTEGLLQVGEGRVES